MLRKKKNASPSLCPSFAFGQLSSLSPRIYSWKDLSPVESALPRDFVPNPFVVRSYKKRGRGGSHRCLISIRLDATIQAPRSAEGRDYFKKNALCMALGKGLHRITRCDDKEEVSMTSDERYDELAERNHEPGT